MRLDPGISGNVSLPILFESLRCTPSAASPSGDHARCPALAEEALETRAARELPERALLQQAAVRRGCLRERSGVRTEAKLSRQGV